MPSKVKQVNGFIFFVERKVKPEMERSSGHRVHMDHAISEANTIWAEMSATDKEYWKAIAKDYRKTDEFRVEKQEHKERYYREKERSVSNVSAVLSQNGAKKEKSKKYAVRVEDLDRISLPYYEDLDVDCFQLKRKKDRKTMIDYFEWLKPNTRIEADVSKWLTSHEFKLLTCTSYCETSDKEFPVAEISLMTFSLTSGLIDSKHFLIDHCLSQFTDQNCFNSMLMNEQRNGLPWGKESSQRELAARFRMTGDYDAVVSYLEHHLECQKMVLVSRHSWNTVMGCLRWLKERRKVASIYEEDPLAEHNFMCLEDLYLSLITAAGRPVRQDTIDSINVNFDKTWPYLVKLPDVLCPFHSHCVQRYPHVEDCSLSCARKYLFCLFDQVRRDHQFDVIIGNAHIPSCIDETIQNPQQQINRNREIEYSNQMQRQDQASASCHEFDTGRSVPTYDAFSAFNLDSHFADISLGSQRQNDNQLPTNVTNERQLGQEAPRRMMPTTLPPSIKSRLLTKTANRGESSQRESTTRSPAFSNDNDNRENRHIL